MVAIGITNQPVVVLGTMKVLDRDQSITRCIANLQSAIKKLEQRLVDLHAE